MFRGICFGLREVRQTRRICSVPESEIVHRGNSESRVFCNASVVLACIREHDKEELKLRASLAADLKISRT